MVLSAAAARDVVGRYGPRLDVDAHGTLVEAAAARVGQLNRELADLMRMVRLVEEELVSVHGLALWAQYADASALDGVTAQARDTLV